MRAEAFFGSSPQCLSNRGKKAFLRVNTQKIARGIVRCGGNWSVVSAGQIRFQANLSARENQSEGKTKSKP